jgi:cobalt/nickel transport system permease protein
MLLPLFAVHLGDGVLSDAWIACGFALAAAMVGAAMWRLREEDVPRIGVLSAAFFVGSSVHVPLVVVPVSVHLVLNGLVGVVLGRRAPLAIAAGIALQYFLLQLGGLTTIGVNTCVVGIPALAAGAAYPLLKRLGVPAFARGVLLGGGAVAGAAFLNFLTLLFGGKDDWQVLAKLVLLAHVPLVVIEGLMLGVLVRYLEKVKPELLGPS